MYCPTLPEGTTENKKELYSEYLKTWPYFEPRTFRMPTINATM
jgi:hypothetical protein